MAIHDEGFEGLRVLVTGGTRGMGEATANGSTGHWFRAWWSEAPAWSYMSRRS
jgi:hypothetical protein